MPDERRMREQKRAARQKMRQKRRVKRAIVLLVEVLILCLLGGIAYAMQKYDKFQTVAFGEGDIMSNAGVNWKGYKTIVLFGGDSRNGDLEEGAQSDTIIIASINSENKEVRLASVYRDTTVKHADGKIRKANYAYFTGGPKDAINMLNRNFDLDIQDYVTVDFKALADAIDLLGGIEVEVDEAEVREMNKYMNETGRVAKKEVHKLEKSGKYQLDGVQSVTYARIRKNCGGDFKRTERQREVIEKVVAKAKKTDLITINKIINKVFPQISTSFSLPDIIGLAASAMEYEIKGTTGFPMEKEIGRVQGVGSVVVPVGFAENVEELHKYLYPKEKVKKPSKTVQSIAKEVEELTGITRADFEMSSEEEMEEQKKE